MSDIIYQNLKSTVMCCVCNKHFKQITNSHLKNHNLTVDEYKSQFPNNSIISEQSLFLLSEKAKLSNEKNKGKKRDPEIGKKISKSKIGKSNGQEGRKISEEQKQKQSLIMKDKFINGEIVHWNLGKQHSIETKSKISESCKKYELSEEQYANLLNANTEYRNSADYIPPMLGKKHNQQTKQKISEKSKITNAKKTEQSLIRISEHLSQFNITLLQSDEKGFNLSCNKCGTIFYRTNSVLTPYRYNHYNGEYCPTCYPNLFNGYWTISDFENNEEIKTLDSELYLIRLFNENENFLKIGITINGSKNRWKGFNLYQIEYIKIKQTQLYNSYLLEQEVLKTFNKYKPNKYFGGYTECLYFDQLEQIISFISQ